MPQKRTIFNKSWLINPEFADWLVESKSEFEGRCKLCNMTFSLSNMGLQAIRSHTKGKKHEKLKNAMRSTPSAQSVYPPRSSSTGTGPVPAGTTSSISVPIAENTSSVPVDAVTAASQVSQKLPTQALRPEMKDFLIKEDVLKAEIMWAMQFIITHKSLRCSASDVSLFKLIFPDSKIAEKMSLQKDKLNYVIQFGLAPFFKNELINLINNCDEMTIGFDESLNKISVKQQMDLNVKFWNSEAGEVSTRYVSSVFLGNSTASDLLEGFLSVVQPLCLKKLVNVSADGPNVNIKFLNELKSVFVEENIEHSLLDIGSCGLHTVHGSFKTGMKATDWKMLEFLSALYNLFKCSPARRAEYTRITGSDLFPFKFCTIRWLENSPVAERALNMLPSVRQYVRKIEEGKPPTSASYHVVKECVRDPLLGAKLAFFSTIATDSEPFLREFQTDAPMVPFLHSGLSVLLTNTLERFVNASVLKTTSLSQIDVSKKENLMDAKDVNLGHSTKKAIREASKGKEKLEGPILLFRKNALTCLQKITVKLLERSPLKFKLVRAATSLDPSFIAVDIPLAKSRLELLLKMLVDSNLVSGKHADQASRQYQMLCADPKVLTSIEKYSRKNMRVDHFWRNVCCGKDEITELWKVIRLILITSHGNSNVERGFSINKECLDDNLKEESLIGRRLVYDAISSAGGVGSLPISKTLVLSVKNARSRYQESIEKRQNELKKKDEEQMKKRRAQREVKALQEKRAKILESAQTQMSAIDDEIVKLKKH